MEHFPHLKRENQQIMNLKCVTKSSSHRIRLHGTSIVNILTNKDGLLDCNGELIDLAERPDTLSPGIDPYHNFPSISTVNTAIDEVISAGMDNIARDQNSSSVPENQSISNH